MSFSAKTVPDGAATGFVPFTLCEPNYGAGVAALFNSLVAAGYNGVLLVGLKGSPQGWMRSVPPPQPNGARIRIVEFASDRHLTHAKAIFAQRVFDELEPNCAGVAYFDPDVVLKTSWSDLVARVSSTVSVCADENAPPWEKDPQTWITFARESTGKTPDMSGRCCNAGFVGVARAHRDVFPIWETLLQTTIARGFDARAFTWNGERALPFFFVDQDMLNLAIRLAGVPVWIGGPETMDFAPGGNWISHAIASPKPWKRWYLPRALAGRTIQIGRAHV